MSNKLFILTLAVALLIGGCLGYGLYRILHPPTVISTVTPPPVYIYQKDTITIKTIKYIPKPGKEVHDSLYTFVYPNVALSDSVEGERIDSLGNTVKYKIKHTVSSIPNKRDTLKSEWDKQFFMNLKNKIEKEVTTITDTKFISKPWFLNEWAWGCIIAVVGFIVILFK